MMICEILPTSCRPDRYIRATNPRRDIKPLPRNALYEMPTVKKKKNTSILQPLNLPQSPHTLLAPELHPRARRTLHRPDSLITSPLGTATRGICISVQVAVFLSRTAKPPERHDAHAHAHATPTLRCSFFTWNSSAWHSSSLLSSFRCKLSFSARSTCNLPPMRSR